MDSLIYAIILIGAAFFLFAIRIIFVKGGEFHGTCATNNPMLKNEVGECTMCGRKAGEPCGNPES
ncbi:MAG: hypothetical protein H6548_00390 [Chitinophagales bacterium]|mgnify:CR=1 FL=1|nr:hypothetical protein [Chitinophagales bacterium]HAE14728.1 hypothetical protein [Bacteroidota bacterium]MCB9019304.1 hypothetical protein [Chitinophagales bacterium]MCB9020555.1 hypothetical protein [Chitinophagales bacterium]MCB9031492.1 hypothetical protein [Chitinophagales bacterium]